MNLTSFRLTFSLNKKWLKIIRLIFLETISIKVKIIIVVVIDKSKYKDMVIINWIIKPEPMFSFEKSKFVKNST